MSEPDRPELPVELRHDAAVAPSRAHAGDAGFDLTACAAAAIPGGGWAAVPTGIAIALPPGHAGLVLPRSGMARRSGVTVLNAPGLIDSGYRGDVVVTLVNHGSQEYRVEAGDRIAQLVITPIALPETRVVPELPACGDGRGAAGFGSSGR